MPALLPTPLTRFVGRARELSELRGLLPTARLITLTGPGGSGKTRLALQLAQAVSPDFAAGTAWIDLTALFDPAHVAAAAAHQLKVNAPDDRSVLEVLQATLHNKQLLLVLDNCEQVLPAVVALVLVLLDKCPALVILATSSQPLNVPCEHVYAVPPLSISPSPREGDLLKGGGDRGKSESDAAQLFIDRAREVLPSFAVTTNNLALIDSICRRLDGLPLAIELAAARVKMLSLAQIVDRLEDALKLLTRGTPAQAARHQTLRTVMDWSYQCLSNAEQTLLRRLSVFAGSFTLDAVETVCDLKDVGSSSLDLLSDLADKSWLTAGRQSEADTVRYRLLETIRQYAREQLIACGEMTVLQQRLLEWSSALTEQAEPQLAGPDQTLWLERLETELDNLRAALRWAATPEAAPEAAMAGLRVAGALERLWWVHAHLSEGRAWLSTLLAGNARAADPIRAKALFAAGVLAYRQSDYAAATVHHTEALELRRRLNDVRGQAYSLNNLGNIALDQGDSARAESLYTQGLELRRALNDQWGIASSLNNLGAAVFAQGDYVRAAHLYDESLSLYWQLGDHWSIASTLNNLGETRRRLGDGAQARALFEQSLELRRGLGDQRGVALVLFNWANLALDERNWAKTAALLTESMTLLQAGHNLSDLAGCLERYALLQARRGQPKSAARLYGAAEALRRVLGAPLPVADRLEYDQGLAEVHAQLESGSFAAAWAIGQTLTVDQAVAEALADKLAEPLSGVNASPIEPPALPILRLYALGPTHVLVHDRALISTDWTYTKAKELLCYFMARPPATKSQIGLDVWPEASADQLRNIFHRALHHLRKALGQAEWIVFTDDAYSFNRALNYWCDVDEFDRHLRAARTPDRAQAAQQLEAAIALWRGDFAEDLDAGDWIIYQREELRRKYVQALIDLGTLYFAEAQYDRAVAAYRRLLALDNYQELAHRELMRCLVQQGEIGHALQHYQYLREMLQRELQAEPSPETTMLYERIRRGAEV